MKRYKFSLLSLLVCVGYFYPAHVVAQDNLFQSFRTYNGITANYTIEVPKSFTKKTARGENIELKFVDDYGASILINITSREREEYQFTAHAYSVKMLEDAIKNIYPNYKIHYSEKTTVAGENAFVVESTGSHSSKLKQIEVYFYKDHLAFHLSGTSTINSFDNYRSLFKNALYSLTFK